MFKVTTHIQGIRRLEILLVGVNKIGFRGTKVPIHMQSSKWCKLESLRAKKMGSCVFYVPKFSSPTN
jgi:hypothetical protein